MEENKLPIKTRIVAVWLDIIAMLMIFPTIFGFYAFFLGLSAASPPKHPGWIIFSITEILISLTFLFSSYLIFKRKKIGYWLVLVISGACFVMPIFMWIIGNIFNNTHSDFLDFLFSVFYLPLFFPCIIGVPIIFLLLLLDRKNFFKIAS